MGLQQELSDAERERKANLVLRDEEGTEATLVEQAADSMSSAFEGENVFMPWQHTGKGREGVEALLSRCLLPVVYSPGGVPVAY